MPCATQGPEERAHAHGWTEAPWLLTARGGKPARVRRGGWHRDAAAMAGPVVLAPGSGAMAVPVAVIAVYGELSVRARGRARAAVRTQCARPLTAELLFPNGEFPPNDQIDFKKLFSKNQSAPA